ncbi:hypothetical protein ABTY20_08785 [Streptomyces sp. NPDC126497]|uniref:hypothetical protein n=1 Tax=Streptomyces sp. NPDC126497 TaxID=3155313 RepID=UPI00331AE8F8
MGIAASPAHAAVRDSRAPARSPSPSPPMPSPPSSKPSRRIPVVGGLRPYDDGGRSMAEAGRASPSTDRAGAFPFGVLLGGSPRSSPPSSSGGCGRRATSARRGGELPAPARPRPADPDRHGDPARRPVRRPRRTPPARGPGRGVPVHRVLHMVPGHLDRRAGLLPGPRVPGERPAVVAGSHTRATGSDRAYGERRTAPLPPSPTSSRC